MKKISVFVLFFVCAFMLFSLVAGAVGENGGSTIPDEYGDFIDSLPDDVVDMLPEDFLSDNPEDVGEGIKELSSPKKLLSMLFSSLLGGIKSVLPTLSVAIGIMLFSALLNQLFVSFNSASSSLFLSRLCLLRVILSLVYSSILTVGGFFENLCKMAAAYLPLSGVLYAIGGNVATATASTVTFGICLSVCQFIFTYTAIPVFVFALSMAITSSFYDSKIISSISGAVKKYYTMILSLVMTVLGVSISSQTIISSKADNASMRGAKFIFGNFVPITGGAVSSSLGAVASGVELIRGCVGIGGIIIIFLMLMPVVCHLAVMKLFFGILEIFSFVDESGGGVISQISSLYSYLLGVAAISSSVFILSFALLGFCASAIR